MRIARTIRRTFLLATAGIVAMGAINARGGQTTVADPKLPAFEVASVKPHKADDQRVMMVAQPGGRLTASTALRLLIRTAYRLQDDQIYGGPSWLTSDLFDIVAKAEDDSASPSQIASMIQALLADRFKLVVHHETKELPIYALVLARRDGTLGSQLRRNDCVRADTDPPPDPTQPPPCGSIRTGFVRLNIRATNMGQILQFLSPSVDRVVVDRTGLAGNFDLDLQWTPNLPQGPSGGRPPGEPPLLNGQAVDSNPPSIFTAVQEQLGLKFESTKGPVDVLVIDHVERPTPD
jgi:uncharacterized protein (TIGR03435 family)